MLKSLIILSLILYITYCTKLVSYNEKLKLEIPDITGNYIVISIIGPARVGKSTLINQICNQNIAITSNTMESCTKNIDVYICGPYMFLDFEGDDLGDLNKNMKLSLYASSISQIVIYYSLNKLNEYSIQNVRYFQKYQNSPTITILYLRSPLKLTDSLITEYEKYFDNIIVSQDSLKIIDSLKSIFDTQNPRTGSIIYKTLQENIESVNNNKIKIYNLIAIETKCEENIQNMKNNIFDKCGIEKYDEIISKAECKYLYNICNVSKCDICDIEEDNKIIIEKYNTLIKERRDDINTAIAVVGMVVAVAPLLSDHNFKENIIYTGRYNMPFCWSWKFGGHMCGHILGKCYNLPYKYEYTNYFEFLGVYFLIKN